MASRNVCSSYSYNALAEGICFAGLIILVLRRVPARNDAGVYFNDDNRLKAFKFDKAAKATAVDWEERTSDGQIHQGVSNMVPGHAMSRAELTCIGLVAQVWRTWCHCNAASWSSARVALRWTTLASSH